MVSGWRIRGRGSVTWRRAVDCRRHERRERRGATRGKTPKVIINVETLDDSRNRPSNARSGAPVEVARSEPQHLAMSTSEKDIHTPINSQVGNAHANSSRVLGQHPDTNSYEAGLANENDQLCRPPERHPTVFRRLHGAHTTFWRRLTESLRPQCAQLRRRQHWPASSD